MLQIDGISKRFKGRQALYPLTLRVERGEIFGLLGHNGAGKSTTFGIVLGHVHPDAGDVSIDGVSVRQDRARALARTGAIFETPAFYEYLSGWRNLEILVSLTSIPDRVKMREVVELVGLTHRINDRVSVYSHGMRQRLALAQALLPDPEFILLDEPSEGLDPEGIQEMRNLILRLRAECGLTFILSSHLLSEVEQICSRVAILSQGRMVFCGSWKEVGKVNPKAVFDLDDLAAGARIVESMGCKTGPNGVVELVEGVGVADLVAALVGAGLRVHRADPIERSLEDFYLEQVSK